MNDDKLSIPPETFRTFAAIRERCKRNAQIAAEDPDHRRRAVSAELRTQAQLEAQKRMRG